MLDMADLVEGAPGGRKPPFVPALRLGRRSGLRGSTAPLSDLGRAELPLLPILEADERS